MTDSIPEATTSQGRSARLLLGLVMPIVLLAIGIGAYLFARNDLPGRVATHFDINGVADDSMSVGTWFAIDLVVMLVGVGLLIYVAIAGRRLAVTVAPLLAAVGGLLAGLGAAISSSTALTQRNIAQWQDARLPLPWIFWVGGLAIAAAAVAAVLAAELPAHDRRNAAAVAPVAPLDLTPTEKSVWTSTLELRWMLMAGIAALAAGGISFLFAPWPVAFIVLTVGISMLTFSRIRVRADEHGLHIRYGLLSPYRTNIAMREIESAAAIEVRPMEWGGWGYRGSLKLLRQAAVVLRAGPGLRLDLDGDRTFVVTVDRPETAAALLNAYVNRRTTV